MEPVNPRMANSSTNASADAAASHVCAQAAAQPQSSFLSLPPELVLETASFLSGDLNSLFCLAQTCRFLQDIAEKELYRHIKLKDSYLLTDICRAFLNRPQRVEAVYSLKIMYEHREGLSETSRVRYMFNSLLGGMTALRELYIESPFDNFDWEDAGAADWVDRDMVQFQNKLEAASLHHNRELFGNIALGKLEKLTIHSHGKYADFWDLGLFKCLFQHPKLRYLHLSCVSLPADLPELDSFAATTPLTTLIFDESELQPDSLRRILGTPKALKHLTLGEPLNSQSRVSVPALSSSPEASMQALMAVSHSLETLIHFDPTFKTLADPDHPPRLTMNSPGMRDFYHLRYVECDQCSFLHQGIMVHHALAPPALETLRLRHYRRQDCDYFDTLPKVTPYTYISGLRTLEFVQPLVQPSSRPNSLIMERLGNVEALRERHEFAYELWKSGIDTKVYAEFHTKHTYVPPFLHHEPLPGLLLLYDSAKLGFRRQLDSLGPGDVSKEVLGSLSPDATSGVSDIETGTVETGYLNDVEAARAKDESLRYYLFAVSGLHHASIPNLARYYPGVQIGWDLSGYRSSDKYCAEDDLAENRHDEWNDTDDSAEEDEDDDEDDDDEDDDEDDDDDNDEDDDEDDDDEDMDDVEEDNEDEIEDWEDMDDEWAGGPADLLIEVFYGTVGGELD